MKNKTSITKIIFGLSCITFPFISAQFEGDTAVFITLISSVIGGFLGISFILIGIIELLLKNKDTVTLGKSLMLLLIGMMFTTLAFAYYKGIDLGDKYFYIIFGLLGIGVIFFAKDPAKLLTKEYKKGTNYSIAGEMLGNIQESKNSSDSK